MPLSLLRSTALGVCLCISSAAWAQTTQPAPEQPATTDQTTTTQAPDTAAQAAGRDDDTDFGWIGLLGLIGLAGLMGRRDRGTTIRSGTTTTGTTTR
jgi:hypothetical protein